MTKGTESARRNLTLDAENWLDAGIHGAEDPRACLMERVALLAGGEKSFAPRAISPVLASIAGNVNDRLDHHPRQALIHFIPNFLDLAHQPTPRAADERLTLWVLRSGLTSLPESAVNICLAAFDDVHRWYEDRTRNDVEHWRSVTTAATEHATAWRRWDEERSLPEGLNPLQFALWRTWLSALLDFFDAVTDVADLRPIVRPIVREFLLGDLVEWLGEAIHEYRRLVASQPAPSHVQAVLEADEVEPSLA